MYTVPTSSILNIRLSVWVGVSKNITIPPAAGACGQWLSSSSSSSYSLVWPKYCQLLLGAQRWRLCESGVNVWIRLSEQKRLEALSENYKWWHSCDMRQKWWLTLTVTWPGDDDIGHKPYRPQKYQPQTISATDLSHCQNCPLAVFYACQVWLYNLTVVCQLMTIHRAKLMLLFTLLRFQWGCISDAWLPE